MYIYIGKYIYIYIYNLFLFFPTFNINVAFIVTLYYSLQLLSILVSLLLLTSVIV